MVIGYKLLQRTILWCGACPWRRGGAPTGRLWPTGGYLLTNKWSLNVLSSRWPFFLPTRSCAALWAADLGLWSFFVTYAGSQLTFMTQHEKVIIFRGLRGVTIDLHDTAWESARFSLLTRGHNWPFRCLDFGIFAKNSYKKSNPIFPISSDF